MIFRITHTTQYRYSLPVDLCHNEARLRPRDLPNRQRVAHSVTIDPPPAMRHERTDHFGNSVLYFAVQTEHRALTISAVSEVAATLAPSPVVGASRPWTDAGALLREMAAEAALEARQFALDSPLVTASRELAAYAAPSFPSGRPLLEAVFDLTQRIHREFAYDPHVTTVATALPEMFAARRGVCQDFAHLAIGCLRALGLPARYVSGYVETLAPPGQPRLQGADASHAWFAVFDPDAGWVDFDPTNDQLAGAHHVTVAWGRDYADVAPVKGVVLGGGAHQLEVTVDVLRLPGPPGPPC